jgi:5-methylcytosine-specific restriction endonuclease McrA
MALIFDHPLRCKPYDQLEFVRQDGNKVALYRVKGSGKGASGAFEALGQAFALFGGACFYCRKAFEPRPLDKRIVHRDHVVPISNGGTDHLHNLVIACAHCGSAKGADDIFEFRPPAAKQYQKAISDHLLHCMKTGSAISPSSRPPPKPAAATGP